MLDISYLRQNGVDVDKAIDLFGDINAYNETFQDFLAGIEEKKANLKKYYELKDMPNYAIYAHSIKSDARYLGFVSVAEVALQHEMAGKENNEAFVLAHYPELVEITNQMIEVAKNYVTKEPTTPTATPQQTFSAIQNVLVVADDSELVTNFVKRALGDKYKLVICEDGQKVIDLINNPSYHIMGLLLDLNMPNVGGFEVLDYFKNNNLFLKIPVSIITGEDSKDMINKAFTYGIVDMLVKPFSNNDVVKVVEKTISSNN